MEHLFTVNQLKQQPKLSCVERSAVKCLLSKSVFKLSIISKLLQKTICEDQELSLYSLVKKTQTLVRIKPPEDEISDYQQMMLNIYNQSEILTIILGDLVRDLEIGIDVQGNLERYLLSENVVYYKELQVKQENTNGKKAIMHFRELLKTRSLLTENTKIFTKMAEPCLEAAFEMAFVQKETLEGINRVQQESRVNQENMRLRQEASRIQFNIGDTNVEIKREDRVHNEIHLLLKELIQELETKVGYWSERYANEIDALDMDVLQIQRNIDEQKPLIENLLKNVGRKKELIAKLELEIENQEETQQQTRAVNVIKNWWKNVLKKIPLVKSFSSTNTNGSQKTKKKRRTKTSLQK